jgi:hypothetical protein
MSMLLFGVVFCVGGFASFFNQKQPNVHPPFHRLQVGLNRFLFLFFFFFFFFFLISFPSNRLCSM